MRTATEIGATPKAAQADAIERKMELVSQALLKESDRGCTIFGAALISESLEELLRAFCRSAPTDVKDIDILFQGYAPLASFAARIQVAFVLGILPRELRDKIELVRRLRNDFAHEWGPLDFEDPRCRDRLALIIGPSEKRDDIPPQAGSDAANASPQKETMVRRIAFTLFVVNTVGQLIGIASLAREGVDIRRVILASDTQHPDGPSAA